MIPEPYQSRLIEAGQAKDHALIDAITAELRDAHPELFRSTQVRCMDCAKHRREHEVAWCDRYSQYRSPEIPRECAWFEEKKSW